MSVRALSVLRDQSPILRDLITETSVDWLSCLPANGMGVDRRVTEGLPHACLPEVRSRSCTVRVSERQNDGRWKVRH